MSYNKIIIIGNLGNDPELRYTPQGTAVTTFSLCTNAKKKDKTGELQEQATWFKVTLWRHQAENAAKYLCKGSPVYIEGRLSADDWTDRDGNKRFTFEVAANEMQFLSGGKRDDLGDFAPKKEEGGFDPSRANNDDDIPW